MDATTAALAMKAAIEAGVYPAVLSVRRRRDGTRDLLLIPPGSIPDGVVAMQEYDGRLLLVLGRQSDGSEWPTAKDPENPDAFYLDCCTVKSWGEIPTWGDKRDQLLADELRELNARLSLALESSGAES